MKSILLLALLCILNAGLDTAALGERVPVREWIERTIPLPKEIDVSGSIKLRASEVTLLRTDASSPAFDTAAGLIEAFARGSQGGKFTIRMALAGDESSETAKALVSRLAQLPNSEQAYAIIPSNDSLLMLANTDQGLLYAARTLLQLIRPPEDMAADAELEMPLVRVTDWPDLAERGQWGGNTTSDLPWTSQWKLNVLEAHGANAELVREGARLGVKVVPIITHLEQIPVPPEFKDRADVRRVPDPSKPLPSDYQPSLCMSSQGTQKLIERWLEEKASIQGVADIMVWLSEDATRCFCERCVGKEPYELEVACITSAFDRVKERHPGVRLRLLTTQGSYPVNDRVLAAAPKDVGISYYDGGRTYDSSRRPMIYPLLEDFARSGRWLGVYPQITHSWRTVFPWTGPQFIRFRAQEFVDKRLACMIGYAVPSNRFHEFNVMAMAEWTWNSPSLNPPLGKGGTKGGFGGRSAEEFARAYVVTGLRDPDAFARWAVKAGEAGWPLAESNLLLRLIYDPALGLKGDVPFDHRFEAAEISNIERLNDAVRTAREALALAKKAGHPDMIAESECVLAGLEAFRELRAVSSLIKQPSLSDDDRASLRDVLKTLDESASVLYHRLIAWGARVCGKEKLPTRLLDTACVLFRTCDSVIEAAVRLGVDDPSPERRLRKLGEWSAETFAGGHQATLRFDLTDIVPREGGSYHVGFDFIESAYGTEIKAIAAVVKDASGEKVVVQTPDSLKRLSRWERWCEMRLDFPKRSATDRLFLEVALSGLPPDAPPSRRTCSGAVGMRRVGG